MPTRVVQGMQLALAIAADDHRAAADAHGDEVVRQGDLRFVADKHPAALEKARHFQFKNGRIAKHIAVHPEHAFIRAVVDQIQFMAHANPRVNHMRYSAPTVLIW